MPSKKINNLTTTTFPLTSLLKFSNNGSYWPNQTMFQEALYKRMNPASRSKHIFHGKRTPVGDKKGNLLTHPAKLNGIAGRKHFLKPIRSVRNLIGLMADESFLGLGNRQAKQNCDCQARRLSHQGGILLACIAGSNIS
ncbi:hypothetical protein CDAR_71611 [Caerostris darwini]|uniref:Uncharacterized protein n=1 Tax=Caerostris darwini TaxID=1538125 RepID=A0AAV4M771_9ARAC|nr:hypothetical protein CDAR_71611 [Caerostris darwini]